MAEIDTGRLICGSIDFYCFALAEFLTKGAKAKRGKPYLSE
jgi:hypothetical protein